MFLLSPAPSLIENHLHLIYTDVLHELTESSFNQNVRIVIKNVTGFDTKLIRAASIINIQP